MSGYTEKQQEAIKEISELFKKYGIEIYTEHSNCTLDMQLNCPEMDHLFIRDIYDSVNASILNKISGKSFTKQ